MAETERGENLGSELSVPDVWGGVPQRNKNFTGRIGQLDQLRSRLAGDRSVAAVVQQAVRGLGGVGKTQLAMEYAHRFQADYDIVWWVPADQVQLIRARIAALAPRLGLPVPGGIDDAVARVMEALRLGKPYERWLLVFDNADQPEDLRQFFPDGASGHVLITSRNHRWDGAVPTIEVDVFGRDESIAFLERRTPGITADEADRVAEALGDLPLALEQAGALQAETGITADQYLTLLKEKFGTVLGENQPSDYDLPIAAAWALQTAQVGEENPEALELLRRCAFFGPEPIPRRFLEQGRNVLDSPLREFLANDILVGRAIRELGRYALARIENSRHTIQVHRLVQQLIRDSLSEEERSKLRHEVHKLLAATERGYTQDPRNWWVYRDLYVHIGPSEVIGCGQPESRRLIRDLIEFLNQSGDHISALAEADRAIENWSTHDDAQSERDVLIATAAKARALWGTARYAEAFELRKTTLDRMRTVFGPTDEQTLQVLNGYGADLRARGDFYAARLSDEESLRLHERVFGDHDFTFYAANNLAEDYSLTSDYQRALQRDEENVTQRRVFYGGDDNAQVVYSLAAIARDLRQLGRYLAAREASERAHRIYRELVDRGDFTLFHADVLLADKDLAVNQRKAGAYPAALKTAEDAYGRYTTAFEPDHPARLAAGIGLGNALRAVGRLDDAVSRLERTVSRYSGALGPDHPFTHGSQLNLALVRRQAGETAEAHRLLEGALAGLLESLGADHHFTLTCVTNLATTTSDLGDQSAALALGQDTLVRFGQLLGPDHPHTLVCATNVALDLHALGRTDEADRLRTDTLERYQRVLGAEHPDVVGAEHGDRLDFDFEPPVI